MKLADAAVWDCHFHLFDARTEVRAGHYQPAPARLEEFVAVSSTAKVTHGVLVQPSVYGNNNTVLRQNLRSSPTRLRGVAVVEPDISDAALAKLAAEGVRGVRFNLVSPVGNRATAGEFDALLPRLAEHRLHVQWWAAPEHFAEILALPIQAQVPFVFDHCAGLRLDLENDDVAWAQAARLAACGAWVKLSGLYRLGAASMQDRRAAQAARVFALFEGRAVWGSDWPHTGVVPGSVPDYAQLMDATLAALSAAERRAVLVENPRVLYGP